MPVTIIRLVGSSIRNQAWSTGASVSERLLLKNISAVLCLYNCTYVLPPKMPSWPSAERYFIFILVFVFALAERKNKNKESRNTMLPQAINIRMHAWRATKRPTFDR